MAQCPCPDRQCRIGKHAPTEPAGKYHWANAFELVDRRGCLRVQDADTEDWEPHEVPGSWRLTGGMADIAWFMYKLAETDGSDIRAGVERLAVACKVHRATVFRRLPGLLQTGWVLQTSAGGGRGIPRRHVSVFQLAVPCAYSDYLAELHQLAERRGRHARV